MRKRGTAHLCRCKIYYEFYRHESENCFFACYIIPRHTHTHWHRHCLNDPPGFIQNSLCTSGILRILSALYIIIVQLLFFFIWYFFHLLDCVLYSYIGFNGSVAIYVPIYTSMWCWQRSQKLENHIHFARPLLPCFKEKNTLLGNVAVNV